MRLLAQEYADFKKSAQPVHQLLWGHLVVLLHRTKEKTVRNWIEMLKDPYQFDFLTIHIEEIETNLNKLIQKDSDAI